MRGRTPEVTVYFWILTVLASASGGAVTDLLAVPLGFGITTMLVTTAVAVAMLIQRFVPRLYWPAVVLISAFGSLVVDNLTDVLEVPLDAAVIALAALLIGTFLAWYATGKSLYWPAVLLAFALGTAAERFGVRVLGLGYGGIALAGVVVLAGVGIGHRFGRFGGPVPFWIAYVVLQPVGVALGSLLAEPRDAGGEGFGAAGVLGAIAGVVLSLCITHRSPKPGLPQHLLDSAQ